jgi:hypothetical protein
LLHLYQTNRSGAGSDCNTYSGTQGFITDIYYRIYSRIGGVNITGTNINEQFPSSKTSYQSNNWYYTAYGSPTPIGSFYDHICVTGTTVGWRPQPLPIQFPPSTNKVDSDFQQWYAGTTTVGSGLLVQTDTLVRYIDHGEHQTVVSPTN